MLTSQDGAYVRPLQLGGTVDVQYLALNHPLLRHGQGMAFSGLFLGAVAWLSTRAGKPRIRATVDDGRYMAWYYLRWPLLALGATGLLAMLAAVLW
jgi:hypothetical protein